MMLETFPWIRVPDLGKVMVLSLLFFESLLRRGATGFVDVVQGVKEARGPAASALVNGSLKLPIGGQRK
ncbi:hypothetical protein ACX80R_11950 [Paeniglutamicibacter antarcticus]